MGVEFKPRYIGPSKGTLIALFCAATGGVLAGSALNERASHDTPSNTVTLTEPAAGVCTNGKITMRQDAAGTITMTLPAGCNVKK